LAVVALRLSPRQPAVSAATSARDRKHMRFI
jgi:hypothetical protein